MWSIAKASVKALSKLVPIMLSTNQMIASRFINECVINKSTPETEKRYLDLISNFSAQEKIALCTTVITEGKWTGYTVMAKIMVQDEDEPQNIARAISSDPDNRNIINFGISLHNLNLVSSLLKGLSNQERKDVYTFKQPNGRTPANLAMENPDFHNRMHGLIKGEIVGPSTKLLNYDLLKVALINGYGDFLYYAFNDFQDARTTQKGIENAPNAFNVFLDNFSKIKILPYNDDDSNLSKLPNDVVWDLKLSLFNIDNNNKCWENDSSRPIENYVAPMTLLEATIIKRKTQITEFFLSGTTKEQRKAIYILEVKKPGFAGQNILTLALAKNELTIIQKMFEDLTKEERVAAYQAGKIKYQVLLSLVFKYSKASHEDKANLNKIFKDLSSDERFEFCNTDFKDTIGPITHLFSVGDQEIITALMSGFSEDQRITTAQNRLILSFAFTEKKHEELKTLLVDFDQPKMTQLAHLDLGKGRTALMMDITYNGAKIFLPFIKNMSIPERLILCEETLNYGIFEGISVLMHAIYHRNLDLIEALVEGFTDANLFSLLRLPYKCHIQGIDIGVYGTVVQNLALYGGFKLPRFKKFAEDYHININEQILNAFDISLNITDYRCRFGFNFALTNECTLVESFSLEERKKYLCSPNQPFIKFFLNHEFNTILTNQYFNNAAEWLNGFNADDKKLALGDFIDFVDLDTLRNINTSDPNCSRKKFEELQNKYKSIKNNSESVSTFDYEPASSAGKSSSSTDVVLTQSLNTKHARKN